MKYPFNIDIYYNPSNLTIEIIVHKYIYLFLNYSVNNLDCSFVRPSTRLGPLKSSLGLGLALSVCAQMAAEADPGTEYSCTKGKSGTSPVGLQHGPFGLASSLPHLFCSPHTSWRHCTWKSTRWCDKLRIVLTVSVWVDCKLEQTKVSMEALIRHLNYCEGADIRLLNSDMGHLSAPPDLLGGHLSLP